MSKPANTVLVAAVSVAISSGTSLAEEVQVLPQTVVTATRVEQPVEDVAASLEVITAKQIEATSGRSLSEVLQHAVGIHLRDLGSTSSISIRGFDYGHTLILVDGMRRTEKYAGSNVNNIALENVERIEIVRGPMSALYGSEALGGIINIITRAPSKRPESTVKLTTGVAEGGERETGILHASTSWGSETVSHRLGAEIKRRDPYKEVDESPVTDLLREKREFLNYQGQIRLGNGDKVTVTTEYLDQDDSGVAQSTRPPYPYYERIEQERRYFLGGAYQSKIGDGALELKLGYGSSDASVNRGTTANETTDFDQTQAEVNHTSPVSDDHLVSVGAGYQIDDVNLSTMSQQVTRKVRNVFVQDQWDITKNVNLTLGARYDDYNDFGNSTNPRVMLSWRPGPWGLRAGYGTGFKAPTLLNLYMTDMIRGRYIIRGNPSLQPEESKTYEAAVSYRFERASVELIHHNSQIDNLIDAVPAGTLGIYTIMLYQNINKAEISGTEGILSVDLGGNTRATLGAEYIEARDAATGDRLSERPRWQGRFVLSGKAGDLGMEGRVRHVHGFWAADATSTTLPKYESNYTTVDVQMDYALTRATSVFGGINNFFDKILPENMAYRGTPDDPAVRYFYAGIKTRF